VFTWVVKKSMVLL